MIAFEQTQLDVAEVKNDLKKLKALIEKAEALSQTDDPQTIDDVVKFTGYTKPTIYNYCQKKSIPHIKKNGRLFFFKSEIIDWIKQGRQTCQTEIESDVDFTLSNLRKRIE